MLAISSTVAKALQQRGRAKLFDELRRRLVHRLAVLLGEAFHKGLHALRHRRSRQYRIDGHRGALGHLGEAARYRKLRCLVVP